jgi:hypothetical protein
MVNLTITLGLVFKEAVKDKEHVGQYIGGKTTIDRRWPIYIRKIDPGASNPFTFYIVNYREELYAFVTLPDEATFEKLNDSTPRSIRLVHSPSDRIMNFSFFPAPAPKAATK